MSIPTKQEVLTSDVPIRRTAEFFPSIWGDHFLSFPVNSEEMNDQTMKRVEELKKEVRKMIVSDDCGGDELSHKLYFIDAVQRLGVSYHFETEIEDSLQRIHNSDDSSSDLYTVSLKFRLLRQQGYHVSCGVFNEFVDKGEFKESLASDARGMLELYEATHMSIHGEDLLDQAQAFTTTNLKSCLGSYKFVSASLAAQVSHALKNPLHKSVPRLEHRHYIDAYQQDRSHNEQLLAFAKLDFNIMQKLHLEELSILTRWWKDLDFKTKLPYARDRLVELYLWILFVFYEPRYALGRRLATKVISMVSILDDTFDNYGTTEELEVFTKAIERWDIAALDELPKYMHVIYVAIIDIYCEIEQEMTRDGKSFAVHHAKEAMKALVKAYFDETKWYKQYYTPTLEEYLSVSLVSSSHPLVITGCFLGMGDFATKEAFDWLLKDTKSLKGCCLAGRLLDDIVSHEFEQKRGHIASSVECYMKQYGVEEQDAVYGLRKRVAKAWKDINEECLRPTAVPIPLLTRIMNCTRVCEEIYKTQDGYTNAHIVMKDLVIAMFVNSVPM